MMIRPRWGEEVNWMNDKEWQEYWLGRDKLIDEYDLRLRVYRRHQNLRYLFFGSLIGTALFWAFYAAIWL
jgi:hypothetical protein